MKLYNLLTIMNTYIWIHTCTYNIYKFYELITKLYLHSKQFNMYIYIYKLWTKTLWNWIYEYAIYDIIWICEYEIIQFTYNYEYIYMNLNMHIQFI